MQERTAAEGPGQRFLGLSKASVAEVWAALACLAARFSFSDLPVFLVMLCRGDLSDIACPFLYGGLCWSRLPDLTPFGVASARPRERAELRVAC